MEKTLIQLVEIRDDLAYKKLRGGTLTPFEEAFVSFVELELDSYYVDIHRDIPEDILALVKEVLGK
jgi:hypothetical protein